MKIQVKALAIMPVKNFENNTNNAQNLQSYHANFSPRF